MANFETIFSERCTMRRLNAFQNFSATKSATFSLIGVKKFVPVLPNFSEQKLYFLSLKRCGEVENQVDFSTHKADEIRETP